MPLTMVVLSIIRPGPTYCTRAVLVQADTGTRSVLQACFRLMPLPTPCPWSLLSSRTPAHLPESAAHPSSVQVGIGTRSGRLGCIGAGCEIGLASMRGEKGSHVALWPDHRGNSRIFERGISNSDPTKYGIQSAKCSEPFVESSGDRYRTSSIMAALDTLVKAMRERECVE
jgi:hypothetical protein